MTVPEISSEIGYINGQPEYRYYKAYINYWNDQALIYGDRPFAHYFKNKGYGILTYPQVDRLATKLACKWFGTTKNANVVSCIGDHNIGYLIIFLAVLKLRRL